MTVTLEQLQQIIPNAGAKAGVFHGPLVAAMDEFEINTPAREAAFLAQIAHESGSFRYVRELASGGAYEGRVDLGNTEPGDGIRYKGRGLIQVTGRNWYQRASDALGADFINHPELMETPENACRVSAWWWSVNNMNALADEGDIRKMTRRVNGGTNGLADREAFYERAKQVLGV